MERKVGLKIFLSRLYFCNLKIKSIKIPAYIFDWNTWYYNIRSKKFVNHKSSKRDKHLEKILKF